MDYIGSRGDYWSSTAFSTTGTYSLYFSSINVNPQSNDFYRGHGFSVRCVAP